MKDECFTRGHLTGVELDSHVILTFIIVWLWSFAEHIPRSNITGMRPSRSELFGGYKAADVYEICVENFTEQGEASDR